MRWSVLILLAFWLGGCSNRVISYEPLLKRDRRAEASLRQGVWASPEPGCALDPEQPIQAWPECATPSVISARSFSAREFLAAGEPLIVQSRFCRKGEPPHYAYAAIQPTARDNEDRVVAFELWYVECGPPDLVGVGEDQERRVTKAPLTGLTIDGENCVARTPEAVRNAARASRSWRYFDELRWMRPRRPSDRERTAGAWNVDPLANFRKTGEAPPTPADPGVAP